MVGFKIFKRLGELLDIGTGTQGDVIYRDASGWVKLGAGTSGHFLKTLGAGANPAWAAAGGSGTKTIAVFTPRSNRPPTANFATLDTRNSIPVLDFDDATEEAAIFSGVIPEGANLTSGLKVRVRWMATSATTGQVRWGAAFERCNTDQDSDSFDTATEAHTTTSGTSGIEVVTEITCTSIDSIAAGERFRFKLYRDSGDTTNDTMTGDAEVPLVEIQTVD